MQPQPPCRTTHTFTEAGNPLVYDRWGTAGRPVLLLHSLLLDRTLWWPVAAELAGFCTVIAPDLPGHGETPPAGGCTPDHVAAQLALLLHSVRANLAPVVVAHANTGCLAAALAENYATHAATIIDGTGGRTGNDVEAVLAEAGIEQVPSIYRPFAVPRRDPVLLSAYRSWLELSPWRQPVPLTGWSDPEPRTCTPLTDPEGLAGRIRAML
ncbi:alpha/beta hydrolase [Actinoplanes sp. NBC_00393]|uniref:alpha/beta fold hydrolase n=1 Tax=Actinoplanes sp. NBC_00393 TaxID=2975953 RepID=UPI002E236534